MRVEKLESFVGGWFIGDFQPALVRTHEFEVCVKRFRAGESEPIHYQREAWEATAIIEGTCLIGDLELSAGEVVLIQPFEAAGFFAVTDCTLVAVKAPSKPDDKVLGVSK